MSKSIISLLFITFALLGVMFSSSYASQEFDRMIIISDTVNEDLYAAGESIQVSAPIHGDVTAAAQRISIEGIVGGDVNVAAEILNLSAPVTDDIRAAGRLINMSSSVGDHVMAAGETITIGTKASIQGWVKLAGRRVEVLGNIGKDLTAAGQHVIIGGDIQGNAEITADIITILPSTHINGKLVYRSDNMPDIQSGAVINGAIEALPMPSTEGVAAAAIAAVAGIIIVFGLALIITGIAYSLIFPVFTLSSARTLADQPLQSIGMGISVLLVTPLIIILLMMTIVGYLLALCLLVIYLILLLLGILTSLFYIADLGLRHLLKISDTSKGKRILAFIVAAILLAILQLIPILGAILWLFVLVAGIGALNLQLWRRYSATPA